MSAARAVPLRLPEQTPAVPAKSTPGAKGLLRLVPQRRSRAARTPFVVVLVVMLVGGLLGLLLLNTLVAQDSFTLHDLSSQSRQLQLQEQQLAAELQAVQAPEQLAQRASKLGMVPGGPPAFLRLPDGRVLGKATKGKPAVRHTPAVTPAVPAATTKAAAKPARPAGSTTWTAPRSTPPPTTTGAHR
ncbi:MAG TPA: hypothetical protein VMZ11_02315 [Mycobacteriales bacterium]|nr:hypothetical protein [Mycobacteriales bacterium]